MVDLQGYFALHFAIGKRPFTLEKPHAKYGPVVRITPRELSFATADSWRTIYQYSIRDTDRIFVKGELYHDWKRPSIQSRLDEETHSRDRRLLGPAFSPKALKDQEPVLQRHIDTFIRQLGALGKPGGEGVDMKVTLEWVTFDIISDLTFSESFNASATGKTHPWVAILGETPNRAAQGSLLAQGAPKLEFSPFTFKLAYRCQSASCRGHDQSIVDWEISEAWRNWRRSYPTDYLDRIEEKWLGLVDPARLPALFVGNQHQAPQGFLVLGIARDVTPVEPTPVGLGPGDTVPRSSDGRSTDPPRSTEGRLFDL